MIFLGVASPEFCPWFGGIWSLFGALRPQEQAFTLVGMEVRQAMNFSFADTQKKFTEGLQLAPTPQELWASRLRHLSVEETRQRRRKLGELPWLAALSRPDVRARIAQLATTPDFLHEGVVYGQTA